MNRRQFLAGSAALAVVGPVVPGLKPLQYNMICTEYLSTEAICQQALIRTGLPNPAWRVLNLGVRDERLAGQAGG